MNTLIIKFSTLQLLSWSLLLFTVSGFGHPFYVSICQIDHNADSSSFEITLRFFTDDLETVLEQDNAEKLHLGSGKESKNADGLISNYIRSKFKLALNDQPQQIEYLGKEVELEVTWCFLEIKGVTEVQKVGIISLLFLKEFETQTNIVHLKTKKHQKSLLLHKGETSGTLVF